MGYLMENGSYRWERGGNEYKKTQNIIGLQLTASFDKGLKFHKSGVSFKCFHCREHKPKNTRYLCGHYEKICVNCAMKWVENSILTLHKAIGMLCDRKNELKDEDKMKKWEREMILGALEGQKNV